MMKQYQRRQFLKEIGVSAAVLPFVGGLSTFAAGQSGASSRKRRVLILISPNGTIPGEFWPDQVGENYDLKRILQPMEAFRKQMLVLKGVSNKVKGDGDNHMRGMSCLLTGTKLLPGNIQGGSHTPAGWAGGISIDQELKNYFQSREETRTRFGWLLGICFLREVPERAIGSDRRAGKRSSIGFKGFFWLFCSHGRGGLFALDLEHP